MLELEELLTSAGSFPAALPGSPSGEKFILFEIGEELFCVAAEAVQEVVHPIKPAAVPLGPSWLLGLAAFKGEPVALIDPVTVAGPFRPQPNCKPKTIVFRTLPSQTQFALQVDSLREMIVADRASIRSGEFVHDARRIRLIEHDQLFKSFEPSAIHGK